ncbi:unnamed protein product, partial [Choristocarpus tenellus]
MEMEEEEEEALLLELERIEREMDELADSDDNEEPLDPIELPPSVGSEVWNDQHLQDQLDAYWEQVKSQGARTRAGGGTAYGVQEQQLLPGYNQGGTFSPGDWAGSGVG